MARLLLLNVRDAEENRAALLEDGKLSLLWVERAEDRSLVGNVYLGRVARVEPAIGAAFVDLGLDRPGFLPADDAGPAVDEPAPETSDVEARPSEAPAPAASDGDAPPAVSDRGPAPPPVPVPGAAGEPPPAAWRTPVPIEDRFRSGDTVVVQVARDPIGRKGAALTTHLSFPGRTVVLLPDLTRRAVSRKIADPEVRARVQAVVDALPLPAGLGVVARTACADAPQEEVVAEAQRLRTLHDAVVANAASRTAPALLHAESDFVTRAVRELVIRAPEGAAGPVRVVVDDADATRVARAALGASVADVETETHAAEVPLFHAYGIEREVRLLEDPRVPLPGGASLVIHETEAMWTIDVNSGRLRSGATPEANALETDLIAAREAARQIRLRDLAGLIVIDFIDCREPENRAKVEETLRAELARDPSRMRAAPLSEFMVAEITRRRLRSGAARSGAAPCRVCRGRGRVLSATAVGLAALREMTAVLAEGAPRGVLVVCPPDVADDLERRRADVEALRRRHGVTVEVRASTSLEGDRFETRRL